MRAVCHDFGVDARLESAFKGAPCRAGIPSSAERVRRVVERPPTPVVWCDCLPSSRSRSDSNVPYLQRMNRRPQT